MSEVITSRLFTNSIVITDNNRVNVTSIFRQNKPEGEISPFGALIDISEVKLWGAPNLIDGVDFSFDVVGEGDTQEVYIDFLASLATIDKVGDALYIAFKVSTPIALVDPSTTRIYTQSHIITATENTNKLIDITYLLRQNMLEGDIFPSSASLDLVEVAIAGAPDLLEGREFNVIERYEGDEQIVEIEFIGFISEINIEGDEFFVTYAVHTDGSTGGGSTESLPEAPIDGQKYARQNGTWVIITEGGVDFPEAPVDGKIYGRRNTEWVEVPTDSGGVSGTASAIFITNITAKNVGKVVNITRKPAPNQGAVHSITTDDTHVLVTIEWDRDANAYQGLPLLNSVPVNTYSTKTAGTYIQTVEIPVTDPIVAVYNDTSYTVIVELEEPAEILSAVFTNGYPGTQTELKANDKYDLRITTDALIDRVEVANEFATTAQTFTVNGSDVTVNTNIANRGNTTQDLPAKIRVRKPTGVWSPWFLTNSVGSTDGVHTVKLNNTYPSITIGTVTYPSGQGALKGNEVASISNTITNFNTVVYSSSNGQLSIVNPSIYETNKSVSRLAGDYNVSTNNLTLSATRTANNASSSLSSVVKIANIAPTITITSPSRLRSGGNNSTSAQNHVITVTSTQTLLQAPTLVAPVGVWQGAGFTGSGSSWSRSLQIHDNLVKGAYSWGAFSAVNLAGIEQATINTGGSYVIGGFVSRVIALPAFENEVAMGVAATNYSKVTLSWNVKALPNRRAIGTTIPPPDPDSWCLHTLETNPTIIRILDKSAADSSSQTSYITIEEVI